MAGADSVSLDMSGYLPAAPRPASGRNARHLHAGYVANRDQSLTLRAPPVGAKKNMITARGKTGGCQKRPQDKVCVHTRVNRGLKVAKVSRRHNRDLNKVVRPHGQSEPVRASPWTGSDRVAIRAFLCQTLARG